MARLFCYLTMLAVLAIFFVGLYHTFRYFMPYIALLDKL